MENPIEPNSQSPLETEPEQVVALSNQKSPSLIQKIIWVFSDPFQLGKCVKDKPAWLLPLLINTLLLIPMHLTILPQTLQKVEETLVESFDTKDIQISSDQQEEIIEQAKNVSKYTTPIFAPLGLALLSFVTALIWLFVGNLLIGGEAKLKALFAAISWTLLILTFGNWLKVPFVLLQNTVDIPIGPAVFLPEGDKGFLYIFLNGLDFFYLWQTVAGGIAIAAIYNWSKGKGVFISITILILFLLLVSSASLF